MVPNLILPDIVFVSLGTPEVEIIYSKSWYDENGEMQKEPIHPLGYSTDTKHSALEASHLSVLTKRNVGSGNEIET